MDRRGDRLQVQESLTTKEQGHKKTTDIETKHQARTKGTPGSIKEQELMRNTREGAGLQTGVTQLPDINQSHSQMGINNLQMQFMLLFSRQGKLRLQKWYVPLSDTQKKKISREVIQMVLARKPKMCSFLEWRDLKIVYKRYASLYFCCAVEDQENELITLEIIHRYVELLDKYFGSVCELDIIFNFEKAYYILDEFILGGEAQETSKKIVLKAIEQADMLQEEAEAPRSVLEEIGLT
ncbi:hypothetical protein NFI96_012512 [Prochilodus magdalenae]|nr:hypothetical protein NFI96_012512 [Prochilodus magdalenae]